MAKIRNLVLVSLLAAGCATNSSVKGQINPLAERLAKLEKGQSEMQAQLADLSAKSEAQQAASDRKLADLTGQVQTLRTDLDASSTVAKSAEQAATEARAATVRAELAANKATKAFELSQRRGKK